VTTNAVAVRNNAAASMATYENVKNALERPDRAANLMALLNGSVSEDRFKAVVLHSIARNPTIQRCTLESVLDAVRVSATLQLEPTGILGEGYIIDYGGKAQFEAGYRGLMKLARRSGTVAMMDSQVVYNADQFAIQLGTDPRIDHIPSTDSADRGGFRGVYAWARLNTGELVIEWMTDADVQAVRKSSRAGSAPSSPWVAHPGEMYRKTAIKRLMKRLPLGLDAETALAHEAALEQDASIAPRPVSRSLSAVRERLGVVAPVAAVEASEAVPDDEDTDGFMALMDGEAAK
jgi:recombination protein RecT